MRRNLQLLTIAAGTIAAAIAVGCNPIGEPSSAIGVDTIVVNAEAPADGASLTRIIVLIDTAVPRGQRSVTLHTSSGTIEGKTDVMLTADAHDSVVTFLRSGAQVDTALVSASLGATMKRRPIAFVRAYADSIKLSATKFAIDTGITSSVTITANLKRLVGKPTAGATVSFTATDMLPTPSPHGLFSKSLPSDAEGIVTVQYSSGDDKFLGAIRIIATTTRAGKPDIKDTLLLTVRQPGRSTSIRAQQGLK